MSQTAADFDKLLDRELLIRLVEERPVLWDKDLKIYKDKVAKALAWREICSIFKDDFENMKPNKRELFEKCVTLRWTRIRDAWIKTLNVRRAVRKSGSGSATPYRYDKQLSFLKRVIDFRDSPETFRNLNNDKYIVLGKSKSGQIEISRKEDDEDNDDVERDHNKRKATGSQDEGRKRKHPSLMEALANQPDQGNEGRLLTFFQSILPSLRLFDDDQTLEFQSGVIKLIQVIKRRTRCEDWPRNYLNTAGPAQSPSAASTASQSYHSESMIEIDQIAKMESTFD